MRRSRLFILFVLLFWPLGALAHDYFGDEPGRRSSAKLLTRDEAFLIAVNIAKLPSVPRQILKDIPRPPNSAPAATIEREEIDVATDAGKYRGARRRADRHQRMRIPLVRIPVFLQFVVTLSLKIVWVARSDQVQLPLVADSPRALHRLRRELAVGVF
jgi:hypothetical protein